MSGIIRFESVGPIREVFELKVPDAGIVELSGDQGLGKSTFLKVADAALNGIKPGELGITPTDGTEKGTVEFLGVTMEFKHTRCKATGRLESHIALKGGDVFARIVDPGIKDVDRADAQRLKDIAEILNLKPDAEAMRTAIGLEADDERFEEWFGKESRGSIVDWAAAGRRAINASALEMEKLALSTKTRAESEARQVRDLIAKGAGGSLEDAQAELEAAIAAEATVKAALAARDTLKAMADCRETEVIKEEIARVDADLIDPIRDRILKLQSERDETQRQIAELEARVAELGRKLIAVDAERAEVTTAKRSPLEAELKRAEKRDKALEESKIETTPEAAATAVANARTKVAATMNTAELERLKASAAEAETSVPLLEAAAEKLRGMAHKVDDALTVAVAKSGAGFVIENGGIYINDHSRRTGNVRFEELSEGERIRRIIRVLVRAGRINSAFVIPQKAWEGVSPNGKQEVLEECLEHGILAFAAKVGPEQTLTAEVFE